MTSFNKLFITGCDSKTQWMLPWFMKNFWDNNPKSELIVYDFGMKRPSARNVRNFTGNQDKGWFKKPAAMIDASRLADSVCWLDTDCQIMDNIEDIWDYVEPNKLGMVEDVPWSTRRKEVWHNSGVVAFTRKPIILDEWAAAVSQNPKVGDQEVLHSLVREGFRRDIHITSLPREYNTLRLDFLDNTAPKSPKIIHWTGAKGKEKIRELMNG